MQSYSYNFTRSLEVLLSWDMDLPFLAHYYDNYDLARNEEITALAVIHADITVVIW